MKFLLTGDWHKTLNKPEKRLDENYWETQKKKWNFIRDLYHKNKATALLQPGDYFDTDRANDLMKRWEIKYLIKSRMAVFTVFGQHDLRYHSSDIRNTPLAVLEAAGVVRIARSEAYQLSSLVGIKGEPTVKLYGMSWFEKEIPEPYKLDKYINILLIHKMIIKNEKIWDGQEDATFGNILLKTSGYHLIVSGDNHQHFTISTGTDKHLVNCGSLLRNRIDQVEHAPVVYIYNTDDLSITPHYIPIEPFDKVFDMAKYEEETERDEKLEAFVSRIEQEVELEGLDFIKNLDIIVEENKDEIDDMTIGIIEEVMA